MHGPDARGIKIDFIQPGKPVQSCFIKSFNGSLGDEGLNAHWFLSLRAAKHAIERWRIDHNRVRPHSSLGGLTTEEFVLNHTHGFRNNWVSLGFHLTVTAGTIFDRTRTPAHGTACWHYVSGKTGRSTGLAFPGEAWAGDPSLPTPH